MKIGVFAIAAIVFFAGCASCDKKNDPPAGADASSASDATSALRDDRCKPTGTTKPLDGVTQVGQAAVHGDSIAIGAIGGGRQLVLVVNGTSGAIEKKDLGEVSGDAPPPVPLWDGDVLLATYFVKGKERVLAARSVGEPPTPVAEFKQGSDESFDTDVVLSGKTLVAAWDEDAADSSRGVVKVARAGKPPIVVSGDDADADSPRLLALGGDKIVVAWVERRAEPIDASAPQHDLERPGEDRAFRAAKYAFLDLAKPVREDAGAPKIESVRATAEDAHVVALELVMVRGAPHLFVQDESAETDGAGGRVTDVVLEPNKTRDPRTLVARGAGHALIDYLPISSDAGWLSFTDAVERPMLVYDARDTEPRATAEPAIEAGRPLAVTKSGAVLALRVPEERGVEHGGSASPAELAFVSCLP